MSGGRRCRYIRSGMRATFRTGAQLRCRIGHEATALNSKALSGYPRKQTDLAAGRRCASQVPKATSHPLFGHLVGTSEHGGQPCDRAVRRCGTPRRSHRADLRRDRSRHPLRGQERDPRAARQAGAREGPPCQAFPVGLWSNVVSLTWVLRSLAYSSVGEVQMPSADRFWVWLTVYVAVSLVSYVAALAAIAR